MFLSVFESTLPLTGDGILPVSISRIAATGYTHDVIADQASWVLVILIISLGANVLYQFWMDLRAQMGNNNNNNVLENGAVVPPHVWSWTPFFGLALEMGMDPSPLEFTRRYSKKLNSPIFTTYFTGRRCAFLSDSRFLPLLARGRDVPWDRNDQIIRAISAIGWIRRDEARDLHDQLHKKLHHFLLKQNILETVMDQIQEVLFREMDKDFPSSSGHDWVQFDLMDVVQKHVYMATTEVLVSSNLATEEFMELLKDIQSDFALAYADVPKVLLPKFRKAVKAFSEGICEGGKFMEKRTGMAKFVHELDATEKAKVKGLIILIFGSTTNSVPSIFWLLYFILKDKNGAYESIRNEVDRVLGPKPDLSKPITIPQLDQLVELRSAFHEACRLQFGAFITRDLEEDFVLQPKMKEHAKPQKFLVRKGTRIMGYIGLLHFDKEVFENPSEFQWKRFAPNAKGQAPEFHDRNGRPMLYPTLEFGSGAHSCPGRKLIRCESAAYVAMLLSRYDLRLTEREMSASMPGIEKQSMGVGMNEPDRRVEIELRPRVRA